MRQTLILITVLVMLGSCNNSDTTKVRTTSRTEDQHTDTAKNKLKRQVLIEELKRLRQIVASNDKEKIADIFQFPLSDTALSIYIDDTTYYEQFKANRNKITKVIFLQYFKENSANIWLDQLNNLFQYIHVDSLLYKNTLEYESYIKTEPCFYSYEIEVIKDSVTLRMNMNSNLNYKSSKKLSEDDIPENSSEICEHNFWWVFKFDGKKLHFENISGAG